MLEKLGDPKTITMLTALYEYWIKTDIDLPVKEAFELAYTQRGDKVPQKVKPRYIENSHGKQLIKGWDYKFIYNAEEVSEDFIIPVGEMFQVIHYRTDIVD